MQFGTLHQILNPVTVTWPKIDFLKFRTVAAAILKMAFLAITHQPMSDFCEILYEEAERHAEKGYGTKHANV